MLLDEAWLEENGYLGEDRRLQVIVQHQETAPVVLGRELVAD